MELSGTAIRLYIRTAHVPMPVQYEGVLRMFGHLNPRGGAITSVVSQLPNPGDRLFALGRNPDGTYGTGPQGLLDVSGETVAFADGVPFLGRLRNAGTSY